MDLKWANAACRMYAFDVHCNSYFPLFILLYCESTAAAMEVLVIERGRKGCLNLGNSNWQVVGWIHQGHSQVLLAGVEAMEPLEDAMLGRVLQRLRIVGKSVAYRWVLRWT